MRVDGIGLGVGVYGGGEGIKIYRIIAEDTTLGEERVEHRVQGITVEDSSIIALKT
ncbi:hypothetical protein PDIG_61020 [Penicillium digitatum PHI26]|uniref:Uncharacterized protein n=2 Tax=Penicillium digitatum TaxID=36651 RepID=K9G456_PEND2|nr:hypothetical protein PDIP_70450 [Penicillium digitatum Pd1]EKV08082.1 hypothetical protein PDIP_70450 [Penicillium digitatum Pd1]EKV09623.1 hypothetical protein PDIG_61020 [Penicillium digitatum PHI26]